MLRRITVEQNVSEKYVKKWEVWLRELYGLEKISLGRRTKSSNFFKIINISLHNFSDAFEIVDENDNIRCSLIMGKPRVAPKTFVSIPRLELVAAVLSMKISNMIKIELRLQEFDKYCRTDSRVCVGVVLCCVCCQ